MKAALALLALAGARAEQALTAEYAEANHAALWASFKSDYSRNYTSVDEPMRQAVFKANLLRAAAKQTGAATFGVNQFSDMTEEEFHARYSRGLIVSPEMTRTAPVVHSPAQLAAVRAAVPSKDWRGTAVTYIKNQVVCGGCWAFSVTGAIEGGNVVKGSGELVSLSEQQLISCDKTNAGCNGGSPIKAYEWYLNTTGGEVIKECDYPFGSQRPDLWPVHPCRDTSKMHVGAKIAGWTAVPKDEAKMAAYLVENGPFSVAVDSSTWKDYKSGVLDACPAGQVGHAVLVVGVSADAWIVKNSWGGQWGEHGFVRLAFGSNQCNIAFYPNAPTF